jgi:chemotaxis protein MotB
MPEAEKPGMPAEAPSAPSLPAPEKKQAQAAPAAQEPGHGGWKKLLPKAADPWWRLAAAVLLSAPFLALAIHSHLEAGNLRFQLNRSLEETQFLQEETARLKSVADRLKKESENRHSRLKATEEILGKAEEIELAREQRETAENRERQRLEHLKEQIAGDLAATLPPEKLAVSLQGDTLVLRLSGKGLFENTTALTRDGKEALKTLADLFNTQLKEHPVVVEAYSDRVPIGDYLKSRFPSNTALSAFRAAVITDFLAGEGKVAANRLAACGRGETFPLDGGTGAEADDKNRRVEFKIDTSLSNPPPDSVPASTPPPSAAKDPS